jgi:hypothetical protein
MEWDVEVTDEFREWYRGLTDAESEAAGHVITLLEMYGPALGAPYSSAIRSARNARMRELRAQSGGRPLRMLYAFDPRRTAIILLGGDKTGDDRWYEVNVPIADRLYEIHSRS